MDTPYQPTGSGKWIWRKPLMRDVIEFGTLPDPRDAQIAELEAAWSIAQKAGEGLVAICKDHERRAIVYEARIAELEAALREIGYEIEQWSDDVREAAIYYTSIGEIVSRALMPPPEGDMVLTVEELPA